MKKENELTSIAELGEFAFVDRLISGIKLEKDVLINDIGDDAAVFSSKDETVVSSQIFTEGVDFNLTYFPLKHLGYKVVVTSIANIYAMGGSPEKITVNLALSSKFSVEAIENLYKGIQLACEKYKVDLIGGDTNSSLTGLVISITAIGNVNKNQIISRDGAKEKDLICVTGNLGAAYMGLAIMEREYKLFMENPEIQPKLEGYDYIIGRYLKPELSYDILEKLKEKNVKPTSLIDVSDGLSSDLFQICKKSNVGCQIYLDKLPVSDEVHKVAEELNLDAFTCALNGGQDFEFLFTVSLDDYEKLIDIPYLAIIGHISEGNEKVLVTPEGSEVELKAQGWK